MFVRCLCSRRQCHKRTVLAALLTVWQAGLGRFRHVSTWYQNRRRSDHLLQLMKIQGVKLLVRVWVSFIVAVEQVHLAFDQQKKIMCNFPPGSSSSLLKKKERKNLLISQGDDVAARHKKYDFTGCDPMGDLPLDYQLEFLKLSGAGECLVLDQCSSKVSVRPNPHRTREATRVQIRTFFLWCCLVQSGHPHSHQQVPFACVALHVASPHPVWIGPTCIFFALRTAQFDALKKHWILEWFHWCDIDPTDSVPEKSCKHWIYCL